MNATLAINEIVGYIPPKECVEWCITQKVIAYNNIEIQAVMVVAFASLFLLIYGMLIGNEKLKRFAPFCVSMARITLYFFFFIYFMYIRNGV